LAQLNKRGRELTHKPHFVTIGLLWASLRISEIKPFGVLPITWSFLT